MACKEKSSPNLQSPTPTRLQPYVNNNPTPTSSSFSSDFISKSVSLQPINNSSLTLSSLPVQDIVSLNMQMRKNVRVSMNRCQLKKIDTSLFGKCQSPRTKY